MTGNKTIKPAVLVDLKKFRIRIHKNTIRSIGNPKHVLLLVNPEERILAVIGSDSSDSRAHKIAQLSSKQNSIELYSRSLVKNLHKLCNYWQDNQSYRIYGEIITNKGVAQFHMDESVLLNRAKL